MSIFNKKDGSVLLIDGLNSNSPAEYISEQSCTDTVNFESVSGLLTKRVGTTELGDANTTSAAHQINILQTI